MASEFAVVSDHDQVVEFRPFSNNRGANRSSIDCRARTNFNIVVDMNGTQLRNLFEPAGDEAISKTVSTDHGTTVNQHAASDNNIVVQHDVGVQDRLIRNRAAGTDHDARVKNAIGTDDNILANPDSCCHMTILAQLCGGMNMGMRRNPACWSAANFTEQGQNCLKGSLSIRNDDHRKASGDSDAVGNLRFDNQRARLAIFQPGDLRLILDKRDCRRARRLNGRCVINSASLVAANCSVHEYSQ